MPVSKDLIAKKLDFLNDQIHKIDNMSFDQDAFLFLGEKEITSKKLALNMGKAADFRNRVVHGYNGFDFKLLFKDYKSDLADLHQFGSEIFKYLETL